MTIPRVGSIVFPMPRKLRPCSSSKSVLGWRLGHWILANQEDAIRRGQYGRLVGPTSAAQVAMWLTEAGFKTDKRTVVVWTRGTSIPVSDYVLPIEELLGMPWREIMDPTVKTATPDEAEAFRRWIRLTPKQRAAVKAKVLASPPLVAPSSSKPSPSA